MFHTSLNMTIVLISCSKTILQKSAIVDGKGSCAIIYDSELSYPKILFPHCKIEILKSVQHIQNQTKKIPSTNVAFMYVEFSLVAIGAKMTRL